MLLLPTNKIEHLIYFVNTATVLTYRLSAISLESGVVSRKSEVRRKDRKLGSNPITLSPII